MPTKWYAVILFPLESNLTLPEDSQRLSGLRNRTAALRFAAGTLIWLGIAALIAFFATKYIPYIDDEFAGYFFIACKRSVYFGSRVMTWGNYCGDMQRDILHLGFFFPLYSTSWYVGNILGFLYYPLFLLWPDPISNRFFHVLFLLVQALILSRLFRIRFSFVAIGLLLFFPYFGTHIIDFGPVKIHTTSIILTYALIVRWSRTPRLRYALLIALLTALGIWAKFAYFWILPPLLLLLLFETLTQWPSLKMVPSRVLFTHVLTAVAVLGLLVSILLFSDPPHASMFSILNNLLKTPSLSWEEMIKGTWLQSRIFTVALHDPIVSLLWATNGLPADTLLHYYYPFLFVSIPLFLTVLLILYPSLWKKSLRPFMLYLAFWLTIFVTAKSSEARLMHHAILAFPFFILSALGSITLLREIEPGPGKRLLWIGLTIFLVCFLLINFDAFFSLRNMNSSIRKNQIMVEKVLRDPLIVQNYIIVILDYNMYYFTALYGDPSQHLLYRRRLTKEEDIRTLKAIAATEKRPVLFVYAPQSPSSDMALIRSSFPLRSCTAIPETSLQQILLEDDLNPQNPCWLNKGT